MSALTDVFTAIANAIRSKKGVSTTYKPSQMADAISSIPTGTTPTGTKYDSYYIVGTYLVDVSGYANHSITISNTASKTLIWENESPSSEMGNPNVSFTQSPLDFESLMVKWRVSTTDSTERFTIFPVTANWGYDDDYTLLIGGHQVGSSNHNVYYRYGNLKLNATGNKSIQWSTARVSGSTTSSKTEIIPLAVYGITGVSDIAR